MNNKGIIFVFLSLVLFLFLYGCSNPGSTSAKSSEKYNAQTQQMLEECLQLPMDKNSADLIIRGKIEHNATNGYGCIINLAASKQDLSICNNIVDEFYDECVSEIAVKTGNASSCSLEKDIIMKRNCIARVAVEKQDSSICEKIPPYNGNNDLQANCLNAIAKKTT